MISWLKWLLAQVKAWFQVVMRISDYELLQAHTDDSPISASLGPIDRLIRQLQSLERSRSKHIVPVGLRANQICILVKHLKKFRDQLKNLSEMEDNSFRAKWWMKEIRELCYDTEDYLEEFMRESGAGALGRIASIILYWIQSKLKWRPQLSQFISRAEVLTEISQNSLQEEIKSASISLKKGNKTDISFEKENKPDIECLTSKLVELLAFDDHKQIQLKVVAISGSAGIGKTTLARTLYVKSKMRFHCSAFVWVSRNPDIMSLLTSILSQIKAPPPHGFPDMQDLIVSINTHLERKRYFIVIDDVRRTTVWDIISRAFPVGQCGSRIIITTQSEHVASACSGYELESTIFQIDAVNSCTDTTSEEKNEVLNLRYNNLPLHLKTCLLYLGMYLEGCTITKEDLVKQWAAEGFIAALQRCRTEEISEVLQCGREEISKVPRKKKDEISEASQDQSSEIEEVPKDEKGEIEEIPQDKGVERTEAPKKETEQIAGGYFDELVTRGMIQPVDKNHKGEVLSCIVHHMVLDLIRYKSKEDNFMVVVDNLESTIGHPDIVRRLSIQFGSEKGASIPESIILSQVRSLAFCGFLKCVPSVADYGLLRVLILNIWADEDKIFDLTRIGELYHLIYLKIECNITVRLPSEIQMLHHLSTLQVGARLFDVPSGIVHLEKLLHLLLPSECILPHGIGSMTSLRTLGYFDLGSNSENNVRCLDELKNLQDLQLTCSTREPAENLEKNMQLLLGSVLQKLSFLRSVTLVPASGSCKGNAQPDYGAASSMSISCDGFSSLVPVSARHLEILKLSPHCCIFSRLPKWLAELAQLCVLKIAVRELTKEDINILKGLSALAALSLHVASVSSEIIVFGKGGFSFLTYFKFTCHVPWLKFEADAMPNLQKLSLGFNATIGDKQGVIIEYLSGIKEISAVIGCVVDGAEPAWQKAITNDPRNPKVQWMGSAFYGDQGTGHMVTEEYCITQDIEKNICHDISKDDPLNLAEKIVRNLENATKDLDAKGNDVRREIADAELQHRTPTNEAKRWLQKVDKIICDVEVISQDCRQLKKDVTMLASEKLHEVQECLSSCPSSVAIESMSQEMSGPSMSAENSNLQDALGYLKDDPTAGMIGIWGPGGVGKTHLLKNIKNSFGGCMTFDFVVFVTASKECSVEKVQSQIIERLKLRSSGSKSHIIYEYMKTKSFLVLLDDLWDEIDLEDVGIPYPLGSVNNLNRKVVLTTRLRKVCGQMNVKKELKVAYLQEHEAWQLFKENIGAETLSTPHIEALARKLVKELKGLPLALITIGKAMYRKDEYQWETAIQYMKQSCCVDDKDPIELGMETNVFRRLKFSYDNLRSKTLRDCFLTCALWPEDENIRKVDLAQCWMGLGLVNEHDIESSFRKSYSLIADLTAACLLEGCENDLPRYFKKPDDSVKVHDVIRDMALWISCDCGENNDKWIVATPGGIDQKVITLSNKAECVSLMSNRDQKVITLSNKAECISLMSNRLPIRFDLDPIELRILCLRNNRLDESIIVEAIKNCSSLTYLDLRSNNLKRIPEELCSLVKLEHLDLSENQFGETEVPHSFGKLINLKFLYLRSFDGLRIPAGVISSLKALQVIDLRGFLRKSILHKWIFLELGTLPQLKALGIGVQRFPQFKSLLGEAANLPVRYLNMQSVGADLTGILSTDFAKRTLYELDIRDWGTREITVEHDTEQPNTHFGALNYLRLGGMTSFREMKWMGATPAFIFPRLTCLELFCCPNISHLSWVMYLPRLEELCIDYCSGMVQAFMRCHGDKLCNGQDKTKTFPCLKLLILGYNKSLETIVDKGMEFPSLGRLEIIECPKLKRLPFQLDSLPPKLKELWFSDAQCWERLECEEGVKTLLQPVLKFWQRI